MEIRHNVREAVDAFCQEIWNVYEDHPERLPAEVTVNNVGTGIMAKVDEDGLYFEANGDEFDMDGFFMENDFSSDTLGFRPHH